METKGFSPDGFITDQDCFEDYRYRTMQASINGCGPIAVYNILHALGQTPELTALLREMEALHRVQRPGPTTMRAMRAIWYFDYDIRDTNYELRRVCHILTHPPFIFGALKLGL